MKCKLCGDSIINGIGYQSRKGFICSQCYNNFEGIIIKDGKFLVEKSFIEMFYLKDTFL